MLAALAEGVKGLTLSRSLDQSLSEEVNDIESEGLTSFPGIATASWMKIAMSKNEIGIPFCEKASGSFDLKLAMSTEK